MKKWQKRAVKKAYGQKKRDRKAFNRIRRALKGIVLTWKPSLGVLRFKPVFPMLVSREYK